MYSIFLPLHSLIRWLLLLVAIGAVARAFIGWFGKKAWNQTDDRLGLAFTSFMDLQLLVGLILYGFLSPITQSTFLNFAGAMSNSEARFFAVEHIFMMVIAVVLSHIGRALSKKGASDLVKHRRAAIWFGLALLVVLISIPWPFSAVARPLFRF